MVWRTTLKKLSLGILVMTALDFLVVEFLTDLVDGQTCTRFSLIR